GPGRMGRHWAGTPWAWAEMPRGCSTGDAVSETGKAIVWRWSVEAIAGCIGETCCGSRRWDYSATTGEACSRTNPYRSALESTGSKEISAGEKNARTTAPYR